MSNFLDLATEIHSIQTSCMKNRVDFVDIYDDNNVGALDSGNVNDNMVNVDQLDGLAQENLPCIKVSENVDCSDIYSVEFDRNPSPLKPEKFLIWLDGYDKFEKAQLLHNLNNGIRVPSSKDCSNQLDIPLNHNSTYSFQESVQKKISSNLDKGWVAGPFPIRPKDLIVSPLASIPKKESGSRRVIHNLSHPYGDSVNSNIPSHFSKVSYETLDTCIDIIASIGEGTLVAKGDILDAYYILKIEKNSYKLLGFFWQGNYYFQKCLPMGLTTSCNEFELFSRAVQWILINKLNVKHMSHILDDFMFFGRPDTNDCLNGLNAFIALSESLGIPLKEEKTVLPTTRVELHGILVDTKEMKLIVPDDK
ncbi:MAG: hypothetical protein GY702_15175, partial [Desulfobulbaceae bacterium]|nr:hypothetical protein [Desulfobulbaceae bacterium]